MEIRADETEKKTYVNLMTQKQKLSKIKHNGKKRLKKKEQSQCGTKSSYLIYLEFEYQKEKRERQESKMKNI